MTLHQARQVSPTGSPPRAPLDGEPLRRAGTSIRLATVLFVSVCTPFSDAPAQELLWQREACSMAQDVAVDSRGNVVTLGFYGGQTLQKYCPDGNLLWSTSDPVGLHGAVATDPSDCVVKISSFGEVMKLSPQGEVIWVKDVYELDRCSPWDVACDGQGNSIVTGSDLWVVIMKLSETGDLLWKREEVNYALLPSCAVDREGNVIVVATEQCEPNIPYDWKTYKYSPEGAKLWERREGDYFDNAVSTVCTDDYGSVYVGGDEWLVKYSSEGDLVWFDPAGLSQVRSIVCDGVAHLYVLTDVQSYDVTPIDPMPAPPQLSCCDLDGNLEWIVSAVGAPGGVARAIANGPWSTLAQVTNPLDRPRLSTALYSVGELGVDPAPCDSVQLSAFPNPATGGVTIRVAVPGTSSCRVDVFDLLGRRVRRLGVHAGRWWWDCLDAQGRVVPDGAYVCRLISADGCRGQARVIVRE